MIDNEGENRTYLCPMCNIIFYTMSVERIKKHFIEHKKLSSILQQKIREESYLNFLLYTANNKLQEKEKMINILKRTNEYHVILRELTKKKCLSVFVNEYQEELKKLLLEEKKEIKRKQYQERKKEKNISLLDINLELEENKSTNTISDKFYQQMKLIKRDNDDKQMVIKQKKKEIESLKQDNDSLYEQLKNTKKNLEITTKSKEFLQTQLKEYRINSIEEFSKLKLNYDSLMKQLDETQNKKIMVENAIKIKKSTISHLKKTIVKNDEIINKNKKEIKALKQQIEDKDCKHLNNIKCLKDKYYDENENLKNQIEKLQNELTNEKSEHNKTENKISLIQKNIDNEKKIYQKEKEQLKTIIEEKNKLISNLNDVISNLNKQLSCIKYKHHRKNHKIGYNKNNNVYSYHNSSFEQTNLNNYSGFQNNEEESKKYDIRRQTSFDDSNYCKINRDIIKDNMPHQSRFSSWIEETENRTPSKDKPYKYSSSNEKDLADNNYGWNLDDNIKVSWEENSKELDNKFINKDIFQKPNIINKLLTMNKYRSIHSIWLEKDNKRESEWIEGSNSSNMIHSKRDFSFDSIQNSQEGNISSWDQ